jgi:hypothetical protein
VKKAQPAQSNASFFPPPAQSREQSVVVVVVVAPAIASALPHLLS